MGAEVATLVRSQQAAALVATLYTIGLQGQRTVCLAWRGPFPDPIDDLIEQVEERALRQANALGGVHAFQLEMADAEGRVLGTEFFRVSAEPMGSIVAEPANEGGVLAQHMRLLEACFRSQVGGSEKLLHQAIKMMERSDARAVHFEDSYLKALITVGDAIRGEREHELEIRKIEAHGKSKEIVARKIAALLPEVTAGVFNRYGGPQGAAHAAAISAKGLFESIDGEQLQAIMNALRPEQQAGLFALMKRLAKEEEARAAQEPKTEQVAHAAG